MSDAVGRPAETNVAARRVLLDALQALTPHLPALVVAGAQAVYLRTGADDLELAAVAAYTFDGDLTINPSLLGADPGLEEAMIRAGFSLQPREGGHTEPGIWLATAQVGDMEVVIPVDLIVPDGVAPGTGRRSARLGVPHGDRAARRVPGLEAALVDNSLMTIRALESTDHRSIDVAVAGEAALIISKLHKLHDRVVQNRAHRRHDKDAGDIVRLMRVTSPRKIGTTFVRLAADDVAGPTTGRALLYLDELFARPGRAGIVMAARAMEGAMRQDTVEALCTAYTEQLLDAAQRST